MPQTGIIILCHGSRGKQAVADLPVTMQSMAEGVRSLIPAEVEVAWAALQFNRPALEDAAALLVERGVKSIVIMPYFLFSGRHITEDIPEVIEPLAGRYPDVKFGMTRSLGDEERFVPQVVDRIMESTPELSLEITPSLISPGDIERRSLEIIEKLLPPQTELPGGERDVVKRIIHASGDPQIAPLIRFSPSAVSSGVDAMTNSSTIFTDVQMAAVGINRRLAESCGCPVLCALDDTESGNGSAGKSTRAAAAIKGLGEKLDGAIVVIGNAPTALLALLELHDNDAISPALIVGMPVGFVRARESKDMLMRRDVPYITVAGNRGGSAMAVATVNAMLKLALDEKRKE